MFVHGLAPVSKGYGKSFLEARYSVFFQIRGNLLHISRTMIDNVHQQPFQDSKISLFISQSKQRLTVYLIRGKYEQTASFPNF